MKTYLAAFLLTLVIESAVALAMGYRGRLFYLGIALVNLFTHPLLNALMLANARLGVVPSPFALLVVLEAAVVLVEWHLLRDTFGDSGKSLLRLSFWMNFTSFAAGVLLYWV